MAIGFNSIRASDTWCRCRKRNYPMSIKRLFDVVERGGDIGRRVAALVLPISNRPRVTSSRAGKIGLREPGEHTSGPNLASRDNVTHNPTLYTILETPPSVSSKKGPDIRDLLPLPAPFSLITTCYFDSELFGFFSDLLRFKFCSLGVNSIIDTMSLKKPNNRSSRDTE